MPEQPSAHPSATFGYRRLGLAWALACLLSGAAIAMLGTQEATEAFTRDAEMLAASVSRRLQVNEAVLTGFGALFETLKRVDARRGRRYAQEMLARYPHIATLNAAERPAEDLQRPNTDTPAATQAQTTSHSAAYPVVFVEPQDVRSTSLLGSDLTSTNEFQAALQRVLASTDALAVAPWMPDPSDGGYMLFRAASADAAGEARIVVMLGVKGHDLFDDSRGPTRLLGAHLTVHLGADSRGPLLVERQALRDSRLGALFSPLRFSEVLGRGQQQLYVQVTRHFTVSDIRPLYIAIAVVLVSVFFALYGMQRRSRWLRLREQNQHRRDVQAREEQLRLVTDALPALISYVDKNWKYRFNNKAYETWYGMERDSIMGKHVREVLEESAFRVIAPHLQRAFAGAMVEFDTRVSYPRLGPRHVHITFVPDFDAQQQAKGVFVLVTDSTERKHSEALEARLGHILNGTSNEIYVFDAETLHFVQVNQGAKNNLGYSDEELANMTPADLKPAYSLAQFEHLVAPLRNGTKEQLVFQTEHRRRDGSTYPVELHVQLSHAGERPVFVAIVQDISDRIRSEERLRFLANYDELTGLPNRALFRDRLEHALAQAQHNRNRVAVLFLDMDDFKKINDTFGHAAGDELLAAFAARIRACVRAGDTVARLGGDEFTVILEQLNDGKYAAHIAEKILAALQQPFDLGGHEVFSTASVGVTIYPDDAAHIDELLKNADTAMYRAKEQGPGRFQFFTSEMNSRAFERLLLENNLRRAAERNEFLVYFQPQWHVVSGKCDVVEALLRWQHPDLGLCPPDDFIPVAEDRGLILSIGEWVLRAACEQLHQMHLHGHTGVRAAVNVSARQFRQNDWVETVARVLQESHVDPGLLELELTESTLIYDIDAATDTLKRLKDLGLKLAVDDFGIGYTSLVYLKRFPVDTVKIDRSFVRDIPHDADDAAIVDALIAMAHRLRLTVTAEGVETPAQVEFLHRQGCDRLQGFLLARPMPMPALLAWLQHAPQTLPGLESLAPPSSSATPIFPAC
jgi:diguanylate cyclase (GGDEF)-like protein/PAS domain S-box-containing protein